MRSPINRSVVKGFTLIELLVVAPVAIITIAVLISLMVALVGDVAISRERSVSTYNVQDALDRIEEDARTATAFLPSYAIAPTPQGKNNHTSPFNASAGDLIINQFGTTSNSFDPSRKIVYYADQPHECTGTYTLNRPLTVRIIYFTKVLNGVTSLWRRVIVPEGSTTATDITKLCANPWQKNTCSETHLGNGACTTRDELILDYVSNFNVTYYSGSGGVTTDIRNAGSVKIDLEQTKLVAGESIATNGVARVSHVNTTTDEVPAAPSVRVLNPDLNAYNHPALTTFEWAPIVNASVYKIRYRINSSVLWTTIASQTSNRVAVTNARPLDTITINVTAINDMGSSTETSFSYTKPLWTLVNLEGNWECYDPTESTYACPSYTMTENHAVVFRGLAKGGEDASTMFTLPTSIRPKSTKRMSFLAMSSALPGRIDLNYSGHGKVVWFDGNDNASSGYVSMDGVQFLSQISPYNPVVITPNSLSGWAHAGGQWGNLENTRDYLNRVWINGQVCGATSIAAGNRIATLASSYQQSNSHTSIHAINVTPDSYGAVQITSGTAAQIQSRGTGAIGACQGGWANLSIMYHNPISTAITAPITLNTGWSNYSTSFSQVAARKHSTENLVTLTGLLKHSTTGVEFTSSQTIGTLPEGYRPAKRLIFVVAGFNSGATSSGSNKMARVDIYPTGEVVLVDLGSGKRVMGNYLSLEDIHFIADVAPPVITPPPCSAC